MNLHRDIIDQRAVDLGRDQCALNVRGQSLKGIDLLPHVVEKVRSSWPHRDDIQKYVILKIAVMKKMSAQRCCSAEVMGDHIWAG